MSRVRDYLGFVIYKGFTSGYGIYYYSPDLPAGKKFKTLKAIKAALKAKAGSTPRKNRGYKFPKM